MMTSRENNEEYYKQIFYSNEYLTYQNHFTIQINLTNRFHLFLFIFLFVTSSVNALPTPQINYNYLRQPSPSFPIDTLQLTDRSTPSLQTYKVYRRYPIASYSNGAMVQVLDQTNFNNQLQLKRERYRRTMIDRIFSLFDEDADGQLSKDELYSLSLRLNIFPKFHHFLKKH